MTLGTVTVPGTSSFVLNAAGGSTNTVPGRWGWMEGGRHEGVQVCSWGRRVGREDGGEWECSQSHFPKSFVIIVNNQGESLAIFLN